MRRINGTFLTKKSYAMIFSEEKWNLDLDQKLNLHVNFIIVVSILIMMPFPNVNFSASHIALDGIV